MSRFTTVTTPVSERQLAKPEELVPWANKEILPLLRESRGALNQVSAGAFTLSTAGTGAFTTVWTSDAMPTNSTWHVRATVNGMSTAGAPQQAAYVREAYFANVAGVVAQVGATASISTFETAAACDVQFVVSGQTALLQVRDDGVSTFAWKTRVELLASEEI